MKKSGSVEWLTAYDKRTEPRCAADSARGGGWVELGAGGSSTGLSSRPSRERLNIQHISEARSTLRRPVGLLAPAEAQALASVCWRLLPAIPEMCRARRAHVNQANLKKISQARRPLNKSTAIAIYAGAGCAGARERGSHYGGVTAGANDPHISLQGLRRVLTVLA